MFADFRGNTICRKPGYEAGVLAFKDIVGTDAKYIVGVVCSYHGQGVQPGMSLACIYCGLHAVASQKRKSVCTRLVY